MSRLLISSSAHAKASPRPALACAVHSDFDSVRTEMTGRVAQLRVIDLERPASTSYAVQLLTVIDACQQRTVRSVMRHALLCAMDRVLSTPCAVRTDETGQIVSNQS